jgi:hypothetical protein
MRKGFSDACIVADEVTAAHNIRLFVEFREFEHESLNVESLQAALQAAADLTMLYAQHSAERAIGIRRW